MISKATLKSQLENFPDEFEVDDLIERLLLIQKIEKGEKDISEGRTYSHKEVEKMISKWSK
ncbi:MAG: hypothetical protein RIC95_07410 [Vicingaceae bacterium]